MLAGEAAEAHFDVADALTAEVEELLGPPSGMPVTETLAGAVLVSGVTSSCRAHQLKRLGRSEGRGAQIRALLQVFQRDQ